VFDKALNLLGNFVQLILGKSNRHPEPHSPSATSNLKKDDSPSFFGGVPMNDIFIIYRRSSPDILEETQAYSGHALRQQRSTRNRINGNKEGLS
jgi:hypothetical protein